MKVKGMATDLLLLGISSLGAFAAWRVHSSPMPEEDAECINSMYSRVETINTQDGVALKLKRYINQGAQPIILAHGITGNGFEFDLPHRRHNLALYLAERGYDVWISNFRGCGVGAYECKVKDWSHAVDHLAALDAPALVRGVTEATGRRPIWIGHSMGGMVIYMYLQGATAEAGDGGLKVKVDTSLAGERNRSILGAVTIGSPPSLTYGGGDWIAKLEKLPFYRTQTKLLIQYLNILGRFSPKVALAKTRNFFALYPRLGRMVAERGPIAAGYYNPKNVYPDVGYSMFKCAGDNVTTHMLNQFLALAIDPDFKDYGKEHSYTRNMKLITAPILFITGSRDFVGAENIRAEAYEAVSSPLKDFKFYEEYGHTDLVMGKRVYDEVYPVILSWVEQLASLGAEAAVATARGATPAR
jgi:polyhydroxyalkanoate synthase